MKQPEVLVMPSNMTVQDAKIKLLEAMLQGLDQSSDLEPWLGDEAEDYPDDVVKAFQRAKVSLVKEFVRRIDRHKNHIS